MSSTHCFTEFSKQSPKGILVIYGNLLYKLLKGTWFLLFLFIKDFSKITEETLGYIYLGIAVVLLLFLFRAFLLYKNFQFKIAEGHFVLKQGIFKKTDTSVSLDRIQNINFKQNIIQQLIQVYEVSIETAGSVKTEIAIKALSYERAQELKSQILLTSPSFEDDSEMLEEKPLLKISVLELLKVSLTENHFKSLLLFLAILIGLYQQVKDLIKSLGKTADFDSYFGEGAAVIYGSLVLITIFLLLLIVIGVLGSFVRVFLFHFNLTVFVKDQAFEINQGLTTKKSILLKKEKVQSITISTNPIKEKLGISYVVFKQAISGKVVKKKYKAIKIVGCKAAQVAKIKELLFDTEKLEAAEKHHVDGYYKTRMYFRSSIVLFLFNLILYISFEELTLFFWNILLIPVFGLLIHLSFKKTFYKFSRDLLLLGSGSLGTHYSYLPFFKVQNIEMKQNIFQEKRNIVDLVFQTAAGKIKIPCINKDKAVEIYNYTLYKVENSTAPWM
ncbi:MAG: PH domain-containing protein [Polaribacter sp.]|nr:PH domain-containing protein [Polaribacter sp.]